MKYDEYQGYLTSMIYKFFDKKSFVFNAVKSKIMSNQESDKKLHKPYI